MSTTSLARWIWAERNGLIICVKNSRPPLSVLLFCLFLFLSVKTVEYSFFFLLPPLRVCAKYWMLQSTWAAGCWRHSWTVCSLHCINRYTLTTYFNKNDGFALSKPDDWHKTQVLIKRWNWAENMFKEFVLPPVSEGYFWYYWRDFLAFLQAWETLQHHYILLAVPRSVRSDCWQLPLNTMCSTFYHKTSHTNGSHHIETTTLWLKYWANWITPVASCSHRTLHSFRFVKWLSESL